MSEPAPTEVTITLDARHEAIRSGDRWALRRRNPDGVWDTLEAWQGTRHSIVQRLDAHGIAPSRAAEAALMRLPESTGFRERG